MGKRNGSYKVIFISAYKIKDKGKMTNEKIYLPVNPSKIEFKINGNNKTVDLINGGEINQIKNAGLTQISFEFLLPGVKYPFAYYGKEEFIDPSHYLESIKKLKNDKEPMILKIYRGKWGKNDTYLPVTIENYTVKEDISNGKDLLVAITLKQYVYYGYKKIVKKNNKLKASSRKKKTVAVPKSHTIKKGDTLGKIAKKYFGSTVYREALYVLNKKVIEAAAKKHKRKSSSKGKYLYVGTKIKLPKGAVGTTSSLKKVTSAGEIKTN